ncbi:MAG: hypothetical protein V7K67_19260 [Nostoc sp.]
MKRDGVSHDVSMCPCTNPLILIMGISLLPVARSLFPFNHYSIHRASSYRMCANILISDTGLP